ncbi:MAG: guanylate kinase [Magnetococcus sp. WYHC-3]
MAGERGFMLILSAPSGAGKTTLARGLLSALPRVRPSISTTTRDLRPGERDGVDYHFVTVEAFQQRVAEGAFLEWAEVFGNYYGTSRSAVEGALERGGVVLLDIDWQGARQIRRHASPEDVVTVFILPPSLPELRQRLQSRGRDCAAEIDKRMNSALREIAHWDEYDYLLVNDDLEATQRRLVAVVEGEMCRRGRVLPALGELLGEFGVGGTTGAASDCKA